MNTSLDTNMPSSTHLLSSSADIPDDYREQTGRCCFCGSHAPGQHVDDATSADYFSDDPLLAIPSSDHVCAACAWAFDQREYQQGHWLAHPGGVETPSTGDLRRVFTQLRAGALQLPLAVHVTSSPIRSSHSYLWTPINVTQRPLTVAYDRQQVRIDDWQAFASLVGAVEDLRLHGFTFDELRSGEPRTRNVAGIGIETYRDRNAVIDPHRRTARLELALTLSRSADDQPRTDLTDHDPLQHDE
jgi:hypothetical protein